MMQPHIMRECLGWTSSMRLMFCCCSPVQSDKADANSGLRKAATDHSVIGTGNAATQSSSASAAEEREDDDDDDDEEEEEEEEEDEEDEEPVSVSRNR
jgi:hypothetical protein